MCELTKTDFLQTIGKWTKQPNKLKSSLPLHLPLLSGLAPSGQWHSKEAAVLLQVCPDGQGLEAHQSITEDITKKYHFCYVSSTLARKLHKLLLTLQQLRQLTN